MCKIKREFCTWDFETTDQLIWVFNYTTKSEWCSSVNCRRHTHQLQLRDLDRVVALPLNTVMCWLSDQRLKCQYCHAARL